MIKTRIFQFVGHIHNMQLCIEMISFINHENESILRWFSGLCEPRNFSRILCPVAGCIQTGWGSDLCLPAVVLWNSAPHVSTMLGSNLDLSDLVLDILHHIWLLSSRPTHAASSNSWLSNVLCEHRSELRAAERKWCKSKDPSDLSIYQSLLSSFSAEVHTAKSSYFHNKINSASDTRNLFKTFNSLLCPQPLTLPLSSQTN